MVDAERSGQYSNRRQNVLHHLSLVFSEARPQRQPDQPVRHLVSYLELTVRARVTRSRRGAVQRNAMKHGNNVRTVQLLDERGATLQIGQQNVVHVCVAPTVGGYHGPANLARRVGLDQPLVLVILQGQALTRDDVRRFHLCPQKGRDDLAWHIRRANIHPRILVDLAAKKLRPVRALLSPSG